jgi:lipopolysaccharide transport system permease protein
MARQILIEPQKGWLSIDFQELWEYRELVLSLARRDIAAQYKQAIFGVAWAVVRPVFSVAVYTLIFGKIAKLSSSGIPYPLFTLCGVVAWSFFSAVLGQSTISVVSNANLFTKVYFPRLVIPLASLGRGLVDFVISSFLLALLMGLYGFVPIRNLVFAPLFLGMGLLITLGMGLFLSALTVRYRDLKHAIPFLIQMWFWVTPVAYGLENVSESLKPLFFLNPMTWVIEGLRWSLLGVGEVNVQDLSIIGALSVGIVIMGLLYFKKMEGEFADII